MSDYFDFGFTAVDENELSSVRELKSSVETTATDAEEKGEKLNNLYNAILPLLGNLKKNPEKDYIYWPNRVAKVEEFEEIISDIVK
jgi:hypothetical protein